jgi:quinol monooxygenase YgiN
MTEERLTPNRYWALARKEPGGRRYDMYASEQQGNLVAIEIWDSPKASDQHKQTVRFKAVVARLLELIQGTLAGEILHPIE